MNKKTAEISRGSAVQVKSQMNAPREAAIVALQAEGEMNAPREATTITLQAEGEMNAPREATTITLQAEGGVRAPQTPLADAAQTGRREKSTGRIAVQRGGVLATAILFSVCLGSTGALADEQRVSKGVYVGSTDCSGMTAADVKNAISAQIAVLDGTIVNMNIGDQTVSCTLGDLGLTWSNTQIIDEMMSLGSSGNVIQRYKDQKDLEHTTKTYDLTYDLDDGVLGSYVQSLSAYNTDPENASIYTTDSLTPGVTGGTQGICVDAAGAAQVLEAAVESWDGQSAIAVDIPVTETDPDITYDDLAIVSDVLGTATTYYGNSTAARCTNVENGCSKISGTLLWPGEYFSVTDAVTPFTAENGYEQAPSYEENRVVDSYGGGICQVSTTLYNAVLKSELEVDARSNHTMVVAYVDLSKDAAIAEGVMDFAFTNDSDYPVYIIGYCYDGNITFSIYGHETRPSNRTIEFESRTTSTTEPTDSKLYADPEQAIGYINQVQSPHTGYTAELWKNIYIDGSLTDSVQVNSSYYNAVGTIYDIGVASQNTALTQAMYTAIAANSLEQVQNVITYGNTAGTAQTETTAQTDAADGSGTVSGDGSITVYGTDSVVVDGNTYTYDQSGDVDETAY